MRRLLAGELTEEEAVSELRQVQLEELGGRARLDLGRFLRRGIPEVVLASGKIPEDAARLVIAMAERMGQGLISRMAANHRAALREHAVAAGMRGIGYAASSRVLQPAFEPEAIGGYGGTRDVGT